MTDWPEHPPFIGEKEFLETHTEIARTEAEILEIINIQEQEESLRETHGMSINDFENLLRTEILDLARELKIVNFDKTINSDKKLELLKRQKFAIWFHWDGLNVVRAERGLIANVYIHTSGKDIISNKDIWKMIRDALKKCHSNEGGLIERTELEVRTKMLEWRISTELRRMTRQVIKIEDKDEEFDLVPDFRILRHESESYQVEMVDRKTGIKAIGRGNIKYRNQVDWGTKLELSRKVREFEYTEELKERQQ